MYPQGIWYFKVDGWMDGWTDGWTDGRTDGRTDGWMDGWMDGFTGVSIGGASVPGPRAGRGLRESALP